jgi:predicted phage baseplate assembly protein
VNLPAPNLDDRTFQDIVDEAKRNITRLCPEWTDHNVSDPGVALIELFAWMTELTLYRVNQVPDRLYIKFLELIGIELFQATSARTDILFTLAAPTADPVTIPKGTQVGTERAADGDQIIFMTSQQLLLVQPRLVACASLGDGRYTDRSDDLRLPGATVPVFPAVRDGDALYLGFEQSLAGNLVRLDVTVAAAEGAGVVPENPPIVWETFDGSEWHPARVVSDTSEGFNESGEVTLLLGAWHRESSAGGIRAYWLRCRLLPATGEQAGYTASPLLASVVCTGLGGAVAAMHAEPAPAELLGTSSGEPGQTFTVRRAPVLARHSGETVQVTAPRREPNREPEPVRWREVDDFADCTPQDLVFTWSGATGEIRFGPRVVGRDGRVMQRGAIPPRDAHISVTGYRYGGGQRGNVGAGRLSVLLTAIPSVSSVTRNLDPAKGGFDPETVDNAKVRGPLYLRGGNRAVTAADFERLTVEAAPGARARCVPPATAADPVQVLVVPKVDHVTPEALTLDDLVLTPALAKSISGFLDQRRLLTTRVVIGVPSYQGVKVTAFVRAAPTVRPEMVREEAEAALYRFINPLSGGRDGRGWPFDEDLSLGDLFRLLHDVPGVTGVEKVDMFLADVLGVRQPAAVQGQRIALAPGALFMSWQHAVRVVQ